MKAVRRGGKEIAKKGKRVKKALEKSGKQATKKVLGLKEKMAKKTDEQVKKRIAQKDALIKKLKEELIQKEKGIAASKKSLVQKAKESLLELKSKAEIEAKKLMTEAEKKAKTVANQKDSLIQKIKKELAEKEKTIIESQKTFKETMTQAGKELSVLKDKTSQSILDMKNKADAELKKLKEELEAKGKALRGKVAELDEYRRATESRLFEAQAKVKELAAKIMPAEKERRGQVTFKGSPLTLLGEEVKVGDKAPHFKVVDNAMQPVTLESYQGKIKIITAVPSLDTPVCNMETRRFNQEADKLPDKVAILTISMDLPFAQARWCAAAGVEKVKTFSDFQNHSFGLAYGVLIKELKLLARAVFIVDDQDVIRYTELVPEIAQEPDYDRILGAAKALL
jgi:thiol peroxidase